MKRLVPILAVFMLLLMVAPTQAQVTVNYPSNLRDLNLEVGEKYTFNVWIKNTSDRPIKVFIETEIIDIKIMDIEDVLILEPGDRVAFPITFSILKAGEFSKVLKISFISTSEGSTRKGSTCKIKLEGYAKSKEKPMEPWWLIVILIIIGVLAWFFKKLKGKKIKKKTIKKRKMV